MARVKQKRQKKRRGKLARVVDPSLPALRSAANATKFDAEKRRLFIERHKAGVSALTVCDELGITFQTVLNAIEADAEFAREYEAAKVASVRFLEQHLHRMATERGVPGNVTAVFGLLRARAPAVWREGIKVEHSGTVVITPELISEARARARRLAEEAAGEVTH